MSALVLTRDGEEVTRRYLPRREALRALATIEADYRASRSSIGVRAIRRTTTTLLVTTKADGVVRLEVR